jgi:hypothetical protein
MSKIITFVAEPDILSNVDSIRSFLKVVRDIIEVESPEIIYSVGSRRLAGFVESACRTAMVVAEVSYIKMDSDDEVIYALRESEKVFLFGSNSPNWFKIPKFLVYYALYGPEVLSVYVIDGEHVRPYRLYRS